MIPIIRMQNSGIRESDNSLVGFEVFVRTTGRDYSIKTWYDCLDIAGSDAFSTFSLNNAYNIAPSLDAEKTVRILALVGTTVVPYNLFLHAALVKDSKQKGLDLKSLQQDTYISVAIGGLISVCIVVAAASLNGQNITNAQDMGLALEPILGSYAKYLISLGLFAAGLSSAITAPLAAAFVLGESLSWKNDQKNKAFKWTAIGVLAVGFVFASIGYKPVEIIQFAQFANGLLLPVIGVFIFWLVNAPNDLNISKPSKIENALLLILMFFLFFLGMKSLGFIN